MTEPPAEPVERPDAVDDLHDGHDSETSPAPDLDERARRVAEAVRRRRVAEVFGEVLPEQTGDDVADRSQRTSRDDDLRCEVPPHHV